MCGLIGAFSKNMYDVLYEASMQRGKFAYGHCFLTKDKNAPFHIQRFNKLPKVNDIKDLSINKLHLGHCQAPTSSIRKWADADAHPFVYENWIVAHNGVLTNADQLIEKYNLQVQSKVDTAVIPALLHMFEQQNDQNIALCIKNALNELKGTFGLWIVHKKTKQVFLARQGSTIFANMSTGSFCSVPCKSKDWCELGEGCIYKIDVAEKTIEPIDKFTTDSPFLFIAESEDT
jgi:glucosamine 6-phosphate synthetase-like amidotransferase/phosphosugar isomerase protein